jgi:membrane dipeptidase
VVVSHTCARALNDNDRCVPDDILKAIAEKGGVIAVTFYSGWVSPDFLEQRTAARERFTPVGKRIESRFPEDSEGSGLAVEAVWRGFAPPAARLAELVDHIDHIVKIAGVDHVGIGSDAGGAREVDVRELQDATGWPAITYELLKRGYDEESIEKILGGNLLRAYTEIHEARARLAGEKAR